MPPPFSLKNLFFHWKVLRCNHFPKNRLNLSEGSPKASHIKASHPHFPHFRVFVSALSAFLLFGISSDPCFSGVRGTFRIFRVFAVSVSNRWFRKSDRPALGWPALGDRDPVRDRIFESFAAPLPPQGAEVGTTFLGLSNPDINLITNFEEATALVVQARLDPLP